MRPRVAVDIYRYICNAWFGRICRRSASKPQLTLGFEALPCFGITRAHPVPPDSRPIRIRGIESQLTDRFAGRYKVLVLVGQQIPALFLPRGAGILIGGEPATEDRIHPRYIHD